MATASKSETLVEDLAAPLCDAHGVELVEIRLLREKGGGVLRVTIDRKSMGEEETPEGNRPVYRSAVTLDDCTNVSRDLSDALDMHEGLIGGQYRLEVSSPGLERPLVRETDFQRFSGYEVKVKTLAPIEGRRNFQGELLGIAEGVIRMQVEDITCELPFGDVHRAHLVHRF